MRCAGEGELVFVVFGLTNRGATVAISSVNDKENPSHK
jgi:hypothetical protein